MVYVGFGNICVEILTFDESQKELVNHLDMWPGNFQHRFVLLRIERFALGIDRRRNRTEKILAEHVDDSRIHRLGDDRSVIGDIIQQFVKGKPLDFLGFHVAGGIVEVEDDITLVDLLHEEFLPAVWWNFVKSRKLFQIPLSLI